MVNRSNGAQSAITIGQLAAYAGVTIKAVRHYHVRGLIEEPPRDSSGYRRYSAEHVIALIKVKTLAEAGVPLARIKELLAAGPDRFATAIDEIDRNLQARVEELIRSRERIARLSAGDRLFVSAEVAGFLERLLELGVSRRSVQRERDIWILMQSASARQAAAWIAEKRALLSDPEFVKIYLAYEAAFDWAYDDPRLYPLAARAQRWMAGRPRTHKDGSEGSTNDSSLVQLVASSPGASSPAWDRLAAIARELESDTKPA